MDDIAAATPVPREMCEQYMEQVLLRLSNEDLPDTTERISSETARKVGKYIFPILEDAYSRKVSMKRIILPVAAWLLAVREGASESGQPYHAKDTQSAITAIQEGAVISGILGLENCEQTEVVDNECHQALQDLQTHGLLTTLKNYSEGGLLNETIHQHPKMVLFDHDGTVVDSETIALKSAWRLTNEVAREFPGAQHYELDEFVKSFAGKPYREILKKIYADSVTTLNERDIDRLVAQEEKRAIERLSVEAKATEGTPTVLSYLRDGGFEYALVSNSSLQRLSACLTAAALTDYFLSDRIFSAHDSLPVPSQAAS
jgi:phosphoglycolate phosphatase-like HAD superfamily hydrolase